MIKEEASHIILGVAVIEDIIIISMLAILQSVASTGNLSATELVVSIGTVLAFIAGVIIIGSKTIPKFVDYVGKTNQHDLLIVAILGVAFGLSFIAYEIRISVATGAFFAGVLIAESKVHAVTKVIATPIKDMFASIFFVSVGALMDITLLPTFIVPALVLISVSIASKVPHSIFSLKNSRHKHAKFTKNGIWSVFIRRRTCSCSCQRGSRCWCYKFFYTTNGWSNDNNYNFHNSIYDKDRMEDCRYPLFSFFFLIIIVFFCQ